MLLGVVVYDFVRDLGQGPFIAAVLELLSGLLLVFIFTELITTIRVVIARRRVVVEPFLIVGIVAAVRRLIVISAEAENLLGTAEFRDVMLEIGVLAVTVLLLERPCSCSGSGAPTRSRLPAHRSDHSAHMPAVRRRRGSGPGPGRPGRRPARAPAPPGGREACLAAAGPPRPAHPA